MVTPRRSILRGAFGSPGAWILPALALLSGCTDAPVLQPGASGGLVIAPALAIRGAAAGTPQADALNAAFDRVDRFRLVIRRESTGEQVADTLILVTPGRDAYDLSAPVPSLAADERFVVVITALDGDEVLFESDAVVVTAVPEDAPGGGGGPAIELEYAGPGAEAITIDVAPATVLLGLGGTGSLSATVRNGANAVVDGVPVAWSTADAAVVSVDASGALAAGGEGAARVTATTPTGLSASVWVYVAGGRMAFAQGGGILERDVAGGPAAQVAPGASAASAPAYAPGGGTLVWSDGGQLFVGGTAVTEGGWPSISPDGSKLAFERDGTVWFANLDGSHPSQGPGGSTPAWLADGAHLAVGGAAVQRVKADGTGRTTVASGASLPAVARDGRLAFVAEGSVHVEGGPALLDGVSGRPAWSPSGRWLIVPAGGELMLVDPAGIAPALALGTGAASDPAWQGSAPSASPAAPAIARLLPDPAIPGGEVRLVGSGFDWIIPGNNRVFFPGAGGPVSVVPREVSDSVLVADMPRGTVAGSIRVTTPAGESTIGFTPTIGSIRVFAHLPDSLPLSGMSVSVRRDGAEVAAATTGADGRAAFPLEPGSYSVFLDAPYGYRVHASNPAAVELGFEVTELDFELAILPVTVTIDPASPVAVAMGVPVTVVARAFDLDDRPIERFRSVRWTGLDGVEASGTTLEGRLAGVRPSATAGDATFVVALDDQPFEFAATVTSHVEGRVTRGGAPAVGQGVVLRDADGEFLASSSSNGEGRYRFDGLMAGDYRVVVTAPEGEVAVPALRAVTLGGGSPVGSGQDFDLRAPGGGGDRRAGDIVVLQDYAPWFGEDKTVDVLQHELGLVWGEDFQVAAVSTIQSPIPATTSILILGSASSGSSPVSAFNHPSAQANIESWVAGGGWLVAHLGDNVYEDGFMVPGLSGKADQQTGVGSRQDGRAYCQLLELATDAHPFVHGPDRAPGTADDLTQDGIDVVTSCSVAHGAMEGILPGNAEVLLREEKSPIDGSMPGRPVYAVYEYGAGRVIVGTLTFEWTYQPRQTLVNHLFWTIFGDSGSPPAAAPAAAARWAPAMLEGARVAPGAPRRSDQPPQGR